MDVFAQHALREQLEAAELAVNNAYNAFKPLAMNRTAVPADMYNAALAHWRSAESNRDALLATLAIGKTTTTNP